jgi:uncharacterized protein (UPF0332 family)
MEVNAQAGIPDWSVSASYYAKYFAVYALLSKIGVKCEIHDCTITLFSYLFSTAQYHDLVKELRQSKEDRVDVQYYSKEVKTDLDNIIPQTKQFVLQIEEIIDTLNAEKIADLQKNLKELIHTRRR